MIRTKSNAFENTSKKHQSVDLPNEIHRSNSGLNHLPKINPEDDPYERHANAGLAKSASQRTKISRLKMVLTRSSGDLSPDIESIKSGQKQEFELKPYVSQTQSRNHYIYKTHQTEVDVVKSETLQALTAIKEEFPSYNPTPENIEKKVLPLINKINNQNQIKESPFLRRAQKQVQQINSQTQTVANDHVLLQAARHEIAAKDR